MAAYIDADLIVSLSVIIAISTLSFRSIILVKVAVNSVVIPRTLGQECPADAYTNAGQNEMCNIFSFPISSDSAKSLIAEVPEMFEYPRSLPLNITYYYSIVPNHT